MGSPPRAAMQQARAGAHPGASQASHTAFMPAKSAIAAKENPFALRAGCSPAETPGPPEASKAPV